MPALNAPPPIHPDVVAEKVRDHLHPDTAEAITEDPRWPTTAHVLATHFDNDLVDLGDAIFYSANQPGLRPEVIKHARSPAGALQNIIKHRF